MKKVTAKICTLAMILSFIMSMGVQGVKAAGNIADTNYEFRFNASSGVYQLYTESRPKQDDTSAWVRCLESPYSFRAALVGGSPGYWVENFGKYGGLKWYTIRPGYGYYVASYVYEAGCRGAAIKGESTVDYDYTVKIMWSPDSI